MNFGVRSKNRPFRMPPGLVGVTKTRTPKRYVIGEDPYISSYDQAEDLLKSPDVLQGDEISYSSNNQQGAWTAKVVGRGARKTLKFEKSYDDMFFGKKGDAKKAMKLMQPPPPRKPKKTSFGYTVCPKGYAPNPRWKINKGRGSQCLKECDTGKRRNYVTGRCVKDLMDVDQRGCPPGQYRPHPGARCRNMDLESKMMDLDLMDVENWGFGKKGDAKKAMKLMWKEGITLKQAWKRVKGKDKKSKKEAMSSKKKKAVANAKKAMRMHHREGITLKQAWKRVNRRLR